MIHVKEHIREDGRVCLEVSGVLDARAVPALRSVCEKALSEGRNVEINLKAVVYITREGREFIKKIREQMPVYNIPGFLEPQLQR